MCASIVCRRGGRGDKSFNDSAFAGLERAERELGVTVEMIEPSGAEDREAAMRLFAARGFDLVVGVGFIFSSDILVVANAFASTRFACVDFAPSADQPLPSNFAGLVFREEEGAFLVGAVAGLMSKTKAVGFVGGMNVPLIRKFETGYSSGVRHVCPACRVLSAYAGTTPEAFKDPAKGEAIATSQISAGADVVFHAAGSTGLGVFEAARDMNAWAIGVDSDQYDEMPGTVITSMVKRVDVAVYEVAKESQKADSIAEFTLGPSRERNRIRQRWPSRFATPPRRKNSGRFYPRSGDRRHPSYRSLKDAMTDDSNRQ